MVITADCSFRSFETELRTYSGEDPFDVWDRYVMEKGDSELSLSKQAVYEY